jgi:heme O synthase-like polyprenyltransferase
MFGLLYTLAAVALGAGFLWLSVALRRDTTPRRAALLFHYSLAYLALLFVAMAVDPMLL